MTTSTPPDDGVLKLHSPKIDGQTKPVEGAEAGVALAVYDLVPDGGGAKVTIDALLSGTLNRGDIIRLWLYKAEFLDSTTVDDPDAAIYLRIPKLRLHPDRVNELYYTVERNSSNIGTSTSLLALYNRIRPGLKDRLTVPGGHSELKLLLPDEIKNGVGPDFVSAEICVAYPYCRAYDLITLKCNGETLKPQPKVDSNQAPKPPNPGSEVPITICFTITRDFLDKAKRLDKKLHFSYTVTDQIGNGPDTDAPWSPVQTVEEDLDGVLLPMPILLERKEDYPGDDSSIIDLEKLAGNPLLLVVRTADNRFVVGDDVIATYTAENTGEPGDVVVPVSGKVEEEVGQKKVLYLEVPNDKVFAGSNVTAYFDLRRPDGERVASSKVAHAKVTGARPDLKPPSIKEANGSSLDPIAAKDSLTVVVPHYTGMAANDQISVTWTGADGTPAEGSHTSTAQEVGTVGQKEVEIPNSVVAYNLGKPVRVCYTVYRNGLPITSEVFDLNVQAIPHEDAQLPSPIVNANTGTELNVTTLPAGAQTRIAAWPLIKQGQKLWLRYFVEGNPTPISTTYNGTPVPAGVEDSGMSPNTPVEVLKGVADGAKLRIEFKVGFDGSTVESTAVRFPVRIYTVKTLPELIVDTSPLTLNGVNVSIKDSGLNWTLTGQDPDKTSAHRPATGGVPPYSFTSSDPDIASVDQLGTVRSEKNGMSTITVTDSANQVKTFTVNTCNVTRLISSDPNLLNSDEYARWLGEVGGLAITVSELSKLENIFLIKYRPDITAEYITAIYGPGIFVSVDIIKTDHLASEEYGIKGFGPISKWLYPDVRFRAICKKRQ